MTHHIKVSDKKNCKFESIKVCYPGLKEVLEFSFLTNNDQVDLVNFVQLEGWYKAKS